ncbi:stage IV sporulation protein B [Anaerobranca californiensis DSM 14826]|uniref:Stage IV sporulation protein B n=1 Tax=Anaerobranca californiensis DSM 14826 TaxID=1120989 RepID=A0A1M6L5S9_9FIRM|nr:SpoIVB peptidase [Anaerobranca californiensis]SHJ66566.1 stage IV sporulation protein B [Anaerobranca californiensis DSM 14826]
MEKDMRKLLGIIIACLIVVISFSTPMRTFYNFPDNVQMFYGEEHHLELGLPIGITAINKGEQILINGIEVADKRVALDASNGIKFRPENLGSYQIQFNLLGVIPIKRLNVEVVPPIYVYPGGESIGVKINQEGVMVVGLDKVETKNGRVEPAKNAGFEVGDTILKINGQEVGDVERVATLIEEFSQKGKKLNFTVKRKDKILELTVRPEKCKQTNTYRIGLFIKDSTAGVGTITFVRPETGIYGALGHIITDSTTQKPVDLYDGKIMESTITSVVPSKRGSPGEKRGIIKYKGSFQGDIRINSEFGIFGQLENLKIFEKKKEQIPIALKHQIKTGPAQIMTVIEGDNVEVFDIEIEKILIQNNPAPKGLVVKITDERLLEKTGGIVQGMSGSPIIQNGKLIGAVTHVFVNDPTRGYGCFIEWMIMESKMID